MDDVIVWIIIIAFYAPLHYLLPVLMLFVTGKETGEARKHLIRATLIDASLSMIMAFALVILLVNIDQMTAAMMVLLVSMVYPLLRQGLRRRLVEATPD